MKDPKYQRWLELKKKYESEPSAIAPQEEPNIGNKTSNIAGEVGRGLGRTVRSGVSSIGELGELFVNPLLALAGQQPLSTKKGIDMLTNNKFAPRNNLEKTVDTAVEFATPGGVFGKLGKLAKPGLAKNILGTLGTNNKTQLASDVLGGAAGEAVAQSNPDNPLASLIASLAGSATPHGLKNVGKLTKNVATNAMDFLMPGKLKKNEAANIESFLGKVSKDYTGSVNEDIRTTAKGIITGEKKALQKKAQPHYEKAYPNKVENKELKTLMDKYPVIGDSLKDVLKDSAYAPDIKKFGKNSIHTLDLVKKELDSKIGDLNNKMAKGYNPNKAGQYVKAKTELLETLDKLSPDYKKGRNIYSEELPAIQKIENSKIGKLSRFKDEQLKRVGREIFDLQETNPKRAETIRNKIYDENPDAWKAITRQEIERKMGLAKSGARNFYDKVLKDDKSFDAIHNALFYEPKAQKQLTHIKEAYSNAVDNPGLFKYISKNFAGKELFDLISNPKWSSDFEKLAKDKKFAREEKNWEKVFAKTAVLGTKNPSEGKEDEKFKRWQELKAKYKPEIAE